MLKGENVATLQTKISALETQKFKIYDDYTKDKISRSDMIDQRKKVTDHIAELQKQLKFEMANIQEESSDDTSWSSVKI